MNHFINNAKRLKGYVFSRKQLGNCTRIINKNLILYYLLITYNLYTQLEKILIVRKDTKKY
jgi:hypothetical protein